MTKDDMIAISLLAATDDVSTAEAERLLNLGRDAEHSGDCRQQPWTCMRCHHDDYLKMAGQIQVNLKLFGLCIAELEAFADRAELEAALREINKEMQGAHDGACILPVQDILRRVLRKE